MNTNIKKIFLVLATAVFSAVAWYFFKGFVQNFTLDFAKNNWSYLGLSILFGSIGYGALFALALSKDRAYFIPGAVLPSLAMLLFTGVTVPFLLAAILLYAVTITVINFPERLNQTIKLKYYHSITPFVAGISLVLLAVTGLFIQQGFNSPTKTQSALNTVIGYSWDYIKPLAPQFNSEQTVDQFIIGEYQKQGIAKPTAQMIAEGRKQLSDQTGKILSGSEKMSDVGKEFIENKIADLIPKDQNPKSQYFGFYVILASLLIIWPFLKFIVSMIIALVLKGLYKANVLKVQETQIAAKTLVLE